MAGIGDYIHAHSVNYYFHGIHRGNLKKSAKISSGVITTRGINDFSSALVENHEFLKNQIQTNTNKINAEKMSKELTNIFYKKIDLTSNKFAINNNFTPQQEKELSEIMQIMAYAVMIAGGNKDIKYLSPTTLQEVTHEAMASLLKLGKINKNIGSNQKAITVKRLKTIIDAMKQTFNKVNELQKADGVQAAKIQKVLDEYERQGQLLKQFMDILESSLSESERGLINFDTIAMKTGRDPKEMLSVIFD